MDAVTLGRRGLPEAAADTFGAAAAGLPTIPAAGMVHSSMLLVSGAAIRDGWGDPVSWLRASEAWFAEHGYERLVRRARSMLGDAGAPVPRRGRGESEVPTSLRALGVTSREVDVLKLVVEGRSNKEIAAELYLSPKTVERHLSSLFHRAGVRNRKELTEVGVVHLP
jgi:DNA-binding CsgD family transcriptional regulator